jgi:SAM-dependent methyltransferase
MSEGGSIPDAAEGVESPAAFYDSLADDYDALFDEWWAGARWQARIVDAILHRAGVSPPARLLDCACGIGTQALPLAVRGYDVTATDIAAVAVERAQREADARGIAATFAPADMRALASAVSGTFDVVIACDNALPHMLDDANLDAALASIRAVLEPGGVFLASIRDYDALRVERPAGVPGGVRQRADGLEIVGQGWEWSDDSDLIRMHLFVLRQRGDDWHAEVQTTWYRALLRAELDAALVRAGFVDIAWHMPSDSLYLQPIVTARRDNA